MHEIFSLTLCLEIFKRLKNAQNIHKKIQLISNMKISSANEQNFHKNCLLNKENCEIYAEKEYFCQRGVSPHFFLSYLNTDVFDTT